MCTSAITSAVFFRNENKTILVLPVQKYTTSSILVRRPIAIVCSQWTTRLEQPTGISSQPVIASYTF